MSDVILTLFGNIVGTLTEFFSYIAPGYLALIIIIFMSLMPYTMFRLMQKMMVSHA